MGTGNLWGPPRAPARGQPCALGEMEEQVALGSARDWTVPLTAPPSPQFWTFQGGFSVGIILVVLFSCLGRAVLPPGCSYGHDPTRLELLVSSWTLLPLL